MDGEGEAAKLQRELDEIRRALEENTNAQKALRDEEKLLRARKGQVASRLMVVAPATTSGEAIQLFLNQTIKTRIERAGRVQEFISGSGIDPRVLKESGMSPLDRSMVRKTGFGKERPKIPVQPVKVENQG